VITGGFGADILSGGTGYDSFIYLSLQDSLPNNPDVITDYERGDKINLTAIDANALTPEDDSFIFINSRLFSHTAGELRFADQCLQADVDGDGVADFAIKLVLVGFDLYG
jgi:Ca2+-binding RTX toxin-like protein